MTPPSRLEELLQACLNGALDDAQEAEFARLLQESSEARQTLRSYLQIEGALLTLARGSQIGSNPWTPVDIHEGSQSTTAPPIAGRFPVRRSMRHRAARALLLVAASVLFVVVGMRWLRTPQTTQQADAPVLAQVVEVEGTVDIVSPAGDVREAAAGAVLRPGDSMRTGAGNSVAVLEFANRYRLELSPQTAVRLPEDGTPTVCLVHGVVRGNEGVTPAERPALVVTASSLTVRVEGNRFVLSSTSPDSLRVDMQGGKAEVVRERDQKGWTVESGSAVLFRADAEDTNSTPMPRFVTEPMRILDFPSAWAVHFEPDGKHLLAASYREIQRFGPGLERDRTPLSTDKNHGRLAAFSRDGQTLAVYRGLGKDDPVILWDLHTLQQRARIEARITDQMLALAPDASWVATVDRDETVPGCYIWDGQTGSQRVFVATPCKVGCLTASPNSQILAVGLVRKGERDPHKVLLLDARTGQQIAALSTGLAAINVLGFSPDGRHLAVGIGGFIQIWDIAKGERIGTIDGFERVLVTLAFSPDGKLLAGGTQDGQVWVWDAGSGVEVQVIQAGTSGVRSLAFSPDSATIATGGIKNHTLMIWKVLPRKEPDAKPQLPPRT